jgi:hypothetical protein
VTEENEPRWREPRQLAAQLCSNRSACARNENRLACGELSHSGEVGLYGVAAEKILNLDFAKSGSVALT